ncbi:MAG: hypothetical protein WC054_01570 [Candidatus Nanopelagicales bacterium]
MNSTGSAALLVALGIGLAGCSTAGQSPSPETSAAVDGPTRGAAPEPTDAGASDGVPAGLAAAAAEGGLAIEVTAPSRIPGLGESTTYAVSKDSQSVGLITVFPEAPAAKADKLISADPGDGATLGKEIQTDRGAFRVVQLPLGATALAEFDSTLILIQSSSVASLTPLAKVAAGA